ncbi:MAG: Rieske 2Fe-2S domain-containing protein [Anaerolineae bacterium]|nr:Rieske 2Fe-2S domain-containing protein [Anaerolineae bacterium]
MIFQQGVDSLARAESLDRFASGLQGWVRRAYRAAGRTGSRLANALYGTWLGHPFHPVVTDIVVGTWTATEVLDALHALSGRHVFARCADASLLTGVGAASLAVLSGLTDWQHTAVRPRRVGLVHAIANMGITLLQATSLTLRLLGARRAGRALSGLSYGVLIASSYLGGEMVGKYRIGVNRAPVDQVPQQFVPVMAEHDLPENQPLRVEAAGVPVLLVRQGDRIYAMHATCTHLGGPLPQGTLVDGAIQCPWHGSRFDRRTGRVVRGPASFPEQCLATRVRDGQIEVGPPSGLGRCRHEPAGATVPEAAQAVAAPAR